ncbi:MAG TPA: disulfide bond formation protein B [Usitatibacter sp.]|nr:disulfide bond formation protein B [Usitatibacter sp.]
MRSSPRLVFAAIAIACAALVAYAIFYMQEQLGLDPCPMCILSRYAFIAIGAIALLAAIHGPRGWGLKVYASLITLFALGGIGVSIRHSYLQHFPPKMETCGTDLEFLLNALPLSQALPKIFAGTGSCSKVDWKFLGLSIPEWAGLWFVLFALLALWAASGDEKRRGERGVFVKR